MKPKSTCQIVRTLDVIGEKWSLLIVRNALRGQTRFSQFGENLGLSSDILANRLAKLVDTGIFEKQDYHEPGERMRSSYHLTPRGEGLRVVMAAMMQWDDEFNPSPLSGGSRLVEADGERPLRLAFLDAQGGEVDGNAVAILPRAVGVVGW
ncbi:helix-turn-helix domain-containing protein [Leifsonia kafniensis]|uniref:Helix-turn-helix domain-containing protein n=1 Tax=Leifsonia kafniensis TaxID=475957 RepID=A0ABP7K1Z3_9MICO